MFVRIRQGVPRVLSSGTELVPQRSRKTATLSSFLNLEDSGVHVACICHSVVVGVVVKEMVVIGTRVKIMLVHIPW